MPAKGPTTLPPKALLSFGRDHCAWALARLAQRVQEGTIPAREGLETLKVYLETLALHGDKAVVSWAQGHRALLPSVEALARGEGPREDAQDPVTKKDRARPRGHPPHRVDLVLDNIRSALNVGVLFRSAEALGVGKIHLCGYTPTPDNLKVAKTALGTEQWVPWAYEESTLDCLKALGEGPHPRALYALETHVGATDLTSFCPAFPCALIVGNERFGLGEVVLKASHRILALKLYGRKTPSMWPSVPPWPSTTSSVIPATGPHRWE